MEPSNLTAFECSSDADFSSLLPKESIERLLSTALRKGGDFAEVYAQRSSNMSISLDERKIRSGQVRISQGVGIRVISGEKTGYAYCDDFATENLLQAACVAAQVADGAGTEEPVRVSRQDVPSFYRSLLDPSEVSVKTKAMLLKRANKAAYAFDHRIKQVQGALVFDDTEIMVANSEGLWVYDRQPLLRMTIFCLAKQGKESRGGFEGAGGRLGMEFFEQVSPEDIAREAARIAIVQLDSVPAPAGTMPVVIHGGWGGVLLHEAVGHGLEADAVRKKTSVYADRIGDKVSSPLCTLVDDGTIPCMRGTISIDDEGTPGQRTVLIENGVLKAYMTDRLNAGLLGLPLTGNGRRDNYQSIPIPRMTNFFLEAGQYDPEEVIKSVKRGIFVRNFSGGQVDTTSGNFVFTVTEGYLIEGGRVTSPIRDATLIGNGPEVLNKIEMVGSDLRFDRGTGTCGKAGQHVPVGLGMPTVKVSEITVGGTSA